MKNMPRTNARRNIIGEIKKSNDVDTRNTTTAARIARPKMVDTYLLKKFTFNFNSPRAQLLITPSRF
jgi:hypothetical protein